MGFLDKAKAMADQAMSSLDQTVSPEGENDRRGEQLFRDLGALTWAQHRGSATQATADEIQAVLEELAEVDPNRSLNVGRKHVHSGGTGAAPPPPPAVKEAPKPVTPKRITVGGKGLKKGLVEAPWKALHLAGGYAQLHWRVYYHGPNHSPRGAPVEVEKIGYEGG